jgi:hypothetical protein
MPNSSTSQAEGAEAPKEEPKPKKKHQSGLDPSANTIKAHSIMLRNRKLFQGLGKSKLRLNPFYSTRILIIFAPC